MHGQTAPSTATGGERRLLNVDDVGRQLGGITRRTVYYLISRGFLESVKLGRRRLVVADSVDAYVERLRRESSKTPPRPAQPPSRPPAQPAPAPPPEQPPRRQTAAAA